MIDAFIRHCGEVVGYDVQLDRLHCELCGKIGTPEQFGVRRESAVAGGPRAGAGNGRVCAPEPRTSLFATAE